ncbi:hypothetical protein NX801_20575 [Streptomyces sp. LP05-1]|uniref:Uncharacterized protein n=1 Tax=Streptomyces pyxinae TaxID=2970734 RepID=A0ABT2CKR1_9ACTN|nr:hypothetical protein [Streptomyces sp. LP05-1]MCS0638007.1 hypothetical protein [Streptomyces sp. LP05-1]
MKTPEKRAGARQDRRPTGTAIDPKPATGKAGPAPLPFRGGSPTTSDGSSDSSWDTSWDSS